MIKLEKGNINKLEGKVISYCKFNGNIKDFMSPEQKKRFEADYAEKDLEEVIKSISWYVFYGTFNKSEFIKKISQYEKSSDNLSQILEDSKVEASKDLEDSVKIIPFFIKQLPPLSEEEIKSSEEDVIYTGTFSHPALCANAALMGIGFYHMRFSDQLMKNVEKSRTEVNTKEHKLLPNLDISYKSVSIQELPDFMYKNYVTRMMDARRNDRREEYQKIQDQLISFGKGSSFQPDILELCKFINFGGFKVGDTPIITATINKIDAINREDYLLAARYRDEVTLLKKQRDKGV